MNAAIDQTLTIPVFRTARLTCRPVRAEDAEFYASLFGMPQITAHRPQAQPLSLSESLDSHARDMAHWNTHGFGRWALVHAGRTVGLGGLTIKPEFRGLNLNYHLVPDIWGQGLASEFVRAALDHGRDAMWADEVYGLVRPSNIASIRVLEKSGFRQMPPLKHGGAPMLHLRKALR